MLEGSSILVKGAQTANSREVGWLMVNVASIGTLGSICFPLCPTKAAVRTKSLLWHAPA